MIKIYTDGSCLENPGNGGWAAIINNNGNIKKISGNEKKTTNNRMELMAPINALKDIDPKNKIEISDYVLQNFNDDEITGIDKVLENINDSLGVLIQKKLQLNLY